MSISAITIVLASVAPLHNNAEREQCLSESCILVVLAVTTLTTIHNITKYQMTVFLILSFDMLCPTFL